MPSLDPPGLDWGDDEGSARHVRRPRWQPASVALATFLIAMVTTVLVVVLAGAIGD